MSAELKSIMDIPLRCLKCGTVSRLGDCELEEKGFAIAAVVMEGGSFLGEGNSKTEGES